MNWKSVLDPGLPFWQDYLPLLKRLGGSRFPDCADLQRLSPDHPLTASGRPVRFVAADLTAGTPYETRIQATGEVSTRPENWHDLFNALVWMRLPNIKAAMNELHCRPGDEHPGGSRGRLRDGLTLFDECGVIIAASNGDFLAALAQRDWPAAFGAWDSGATVIVAGHAMLEKFLEPYKSMTANALLVRVEKRFFDLPREARLRMADEAIAARMLEGGLLRGPECLSPLPLAGIPGWWPHGAQDANFYADRQVFRPAREGQAMAPVHVLGPPGSRGKLA